MRGNAKPAVKAGQVYVVELDCAYVTARRELEQELVELARHGLPEQPRAWQRRFVRRLEAARRALPAPVELTELVTAEQELVLDRRAEKLHGYAADSVSKRGVDVLARPPHPVPA